MKIAEFLPQVFGRRQINIYLLNLAKKILNSILKDYFTSKEIMKHETHLTEHLTPNITHKAVFLG